MEMINFLDLRKINTQYQQDLKAACARVIDSGWYLLGDELSSFESDFAAFCSTKHAIGVANGLDALTLVLRAWKEAGRLKNGDEVIVPANTYIASILAVTANQLTPVLVEPDPYTYNLAAGNLQSALSAKTTAVLPVHLSGQLAEIKEITDIAAQHG